MGENVSVKIEGGGGKGRYLYIVKIEIFHPVLTPSLTLCSLLCAQLFIQVFGCLGQNKTFDRGIIFFFSKPSKKSCQCVK